MSVQWPEIEGPDSCSLESMSEKSDKLSDTLRIYLATDLIEADSDSSGAPAAPEIGSGKPGEEKVAGLLSFFIPDYSILFRCKVVCLERALPSTAAVTALRFLETSLEKTKIKRVELVTDSPAFYFAASGQTQVPKSSGEKEDSRTVILREYRRKYDLSFALVDGAQNLARSNSADQSNAPADVTPPLEFKSGDWPTEGKLLPFQRGIEM